MNRSTIMWIGRAPKTGHTRIPNSLIRDPGLSANAKIVAVHLWSLGDRWQVSTRSIAKHLRIGNKTAAAGLKELIATGWLRRVAKEGAGGNPYWYGYVGHRGHKIDPK